MPMLQLSLVLFYSSSTSQDQCHMAKFKLQPNELFLTAMITFYFMVALQSTNYIVFPLVNINVPEAQKLKRAIHL